MESLSQERLDIEGIRQIMLDTAPIHIKQLQAFWLMADEVKRLQAIEQHAIKRLKAETRGNSELAAERDRYKEALKLAMSENQIPAIYKGVQKILEGVSENE